MQRNDSMAVIWYEKAANQGHKEAQYELGESYRYGRGVEINNYLAFYWYEKAAKQGYAKAQSGLGDCYYYGYGVNSDDNKAVEYYFMAADTDKNKDSHYRNRIFSVAEYLRKKSKASSPGVMVTKAGVVAAVTAAIPVANIVTLPIAGVIITGGGIWHIMKYENFLETADGKLMMKCYQKAAELGDMEAKKFGKI